VAEWQKRGAASQGFGRCATFTPGNFDSPSRARSTWLMWHGQEDGVHAERSLAWHLDAAAHYRSGRHTGDGEDIWGELVGAAFFCGGTGDDIEHAA